MIAYNVDFINLKRMDDSMDDSEALIMKAKSKAKKNVRKFGRLKFDAKDSPVVETPTCDLSNLRKPIDTSLSNLRQVVKLFETGTEEVQCILAYECEVVYECRICRSLFRSLINFISHKRIYCPEKFDITSDKSAIDPEVMTVEKATDLSESKENDKKENCKIEKPLKSQSNSNKGFSKKDLTSVVAMLQKKKIDPDYDDTKEKSRRMRIIADTEQVLLEVIESNRAAFQTVLEPKVSNIDSDDLMKAQTTELQEILSCDTAILGPDGHVLELSSDEKCDSPLQFSEKPDDTTNNDLQLNANLMCSVCDTKFATKKTLTFHMKSLHTPNRMVYPCPCCDNLFPSTWGVYRHLVKVHRKSNAQVRKLRADIQAKAYRKETTRAQDIEKDSAVRKLNKINDSLTTTNETQEWMAHLESDGELQRCGGCGKRFDRKAALMAHFQICQRRLAACNDVAVKSKRSKPTTVPEAVIEASTSVSTAASIPVVENENVSTKEKLPAPAPATVSPPSSSKSNNSVLRMSSVSPAITITRVHQEEPMEISIRVEGVASLSKDAWDKIGTEVPAVARNGEISPVATTRDALPEENGNNDVSDDPEIIFTKIEKTKCISGNNGSRKRKVSKRDASTEPNKRSNPVRVQEVTERTESPTVAPSQVTELETRIANIANLRKLQCVPCKRKFSSLTYLRRHMAGHINWYRFRCKVCDFKCFDKIDCVAHCNKIHNAKNNRASISNMMVETPLEEHSTIVPSKSILKKPNLPKDSLDLEVIDVTTPATEFHAIASANEEIDCIQNGEVKPSKKPSKSDDDDGSYCSGSDDGTQDTNDVAKKVRLDEDPELRRMVMEVIFGSSDAEKSGSSNEGKRLRNRQEVSEDISNSSSSESETNSLSQSVKLTDSLKTSDKRHLRAVRNRTKLEDKDFIYDLDAVLLKEPIEDNVCTIKIKDNNKASENAIGTSKFGSSDDLTVILDVVETKLGKVV